MKKKKVGLALGGGAARGLAHIGVLEVLQREGIPIDMIAGTSIGGLVGAFCARGQDFGLLKDMAVKINLVKMLSLADLALPKSGLFGGKAVISMLEKMMGNDVKFEELPIPLALVATDIITGEEVVIDRGSVLEGVRATISIPGIFTVAKRQGRYLVDGGLVNPVPVSVLKDMGADFIIAVNVMPDVGDRVHHLKKEGKKDWKEPNIFNVILQSLYIGTYIIAKASTEGADIVINPDTAHISPGDFHHARECIEEGEIATREAMPEIKRKLSKAQGYDIVKS
ncbi:MAG: patatin-like phospholipase family protein [Dehalococcoidales bacterium]|nr:patatin-like phospholipase family protein [Dehalococcoidales bacterium]